MAQAQVEGLALGVLPAPPAKGDGVLCTRWDARAGKVGEEEAGKEEWLSSVMQAHYAAAAAE